MMNTFQVVFLIFCACIFIWLISTAIDEAKREKKRILEEYTKRGLYGKRKDDIIDLDEIKL